MLLSVITAARVDPAAIHTPAFGHAPYLGAAVVLQQRQTFPHRRNCVGYVGSFFKTVARCSLNDARKVVLHFQDCGHSTSSNIL